jgi:hypothetical protein
MTKSQPNICAQIIFFSGKSYNEKLQKTIETNFCSRSRLVTSFPVCDASSVKIAVTGRWKTAFNFGMFKIDVHKEHKEGNRGPLTTDDVISGLRRPLAVGTNEIAIFAH